MSVGVSWDMGLVNVTVHVALVLLGLNLIFRFLRKPVYYLRIRNILKGHHWVYLASFDHTTHCNVCGLLLLAGGARCDCCGVCADLDCIKKADRKLPCKEITSESPVMKHHWIKGNLPPGSVCHVCEDECGTASDLCDFRCCWCQWMVHELCLPNMADLCTLGSYRNFIIPPNCVTLQKRSQRVGIHLSSQAVISELKTPAWGTQWKPLIVIGNSKSGSSEASRVLSEARQYLNALQVIDLTDQDPASALQICNFLKNTVCRLLIAGGDGTVAWILSTAQDLKLNPLPQSAVLPLGTGNDLSRILGWGASFDSALAFEQILQKIQTAQIVQLDRWTAELRPFRHLGLRFPKRQVKFNNYFSVGVDARVALNFHNTRHSPLYLFSHRLFNKFLYFTYGTKDVVEQSCEGLENEVELFLDDSIEPLSLPALQAIVCLNIDSWGAGVTPWSMGTGGASSPTCDFGDETMEVIGVISSLHIAQMQIGLSEPIRLGQAKSIRLVMRKRLPLQADGEPWEENPCEISISFAGKVPMLMTSSCEK